MLHAKLLNILQLNELKLDRHFYKFQDDKTDSKKAHLVRFLSMKQKHR